MNIDSYLKIQGIIADLATFIGLGITLITFLKVRSIAHAQFEERQLLNSLYDLDTVDALLRRAATALRKKNNPEDLDLAEQILASCGVLNGVTKAIETIKAPQRSKSLNKLQVEVGYFTPKFMLEELKAARRNVDVLVYRNLQFSNVDIVKGMQNAVARRVRVRLLALSPTANNAVLVEACRVLPSPACNGENLRDQLQTSEHLLGQFIKDQWTEEESSRFAYRGYEYAANMHFLIRDNVICMGFLGTLSSAQPEQYEDRPFVRISKKSNVGRVLSQHFENLWNQAKHRPNLPGDHSHLN